MKKSNKSSQKKSSQKKSDTETEQFSIDDLTGYYVVETEEVFDLENDFERITWEEAEQDRLASSKKTID